MSYKANTIHNGELYIRCPTCGDSTKRHWVGHLAINLSKGVYYCHRCGDSGRLTLEQFLELGIDCSAPDNLYNLEDFASLPDTLDDRYSLLTSQYNASEGYRQWAMRKPDGTVVGYHHRYAGKVSENIGYRGLGFVGSELSSTNILRVVEGAYDVVLPDSVCVFGKITKSSSRLLQHYQLCLCPDGDVLTSRAGLEQLVGTVNANPNVLYIELIKDGLDPHEKYLTGEPRGCILSRNEFLNKVRKVL